MEILVAEDNFINQKLIKIVFKNIGRKIDIAIDGNIAVDMTKIKHYDMIFMDIQMPEKDGIEATSEIRALGFSNPIIAMTANNDEDTKERAKESGMNDFITKPINIKEIQDKIEQWS